MIISRVLRRVAVIEDTATVLRRVAVTGGVAEGVCEVAVVIAEGLDGAIIMMISAYVVMIEGFISTRVLLRLVDNANSRDSEGFSGTTTITRF